MGTQGVQGNEEFTGDLRTGEFARQEPENLQLTFADESCPAG